MRNDSIIAKTYYEKNSYYFDRNKLEWSQIKTTDDLIYEDKDYYITSLDFGEWGGATWFRDKKTGEEYQVGITTPVVNKLNEAYYLSMGSVVVKVENPRLMKKCDEDNYYEYVVRNRKFYDESYYSQGTEIIFKDSISDWFNPKFNIITSFAHKNQLYHLCRNENYTYISTIENNRMLPIDTVGNNITIYRWVNSYRSPIGSDGSQLRMFKTNNENLFGLIHLKDNNIYLHYLNNDFSLTQQPIGAVKADNLFKIKLNEIISNIGKLDVEQVLTMEENMNSRDITPMHVVGLSSGYYPNKNKYKLDAFGAFQTIEDSIFTNKTEYYYTKESGSIRAIMFEWKKTKFDVSLNSFLMEEQTKASSIILFQNKFDFLKNYITQRMGEPLSLKEKLKIFKVDNEYNIFWKTSDGLVIKLYGHYLASHNEIRMVIYTE